MIAIVIETVLRNIPLICFIAAIAIAAIRHQPASAPERYLAWLLLLSVGVDGVWAGFFHLFFPSIASAQIGWERSPFEFEIGIADAAMGIVAIASFWRSLSFKSAIAAYAILFYAGVAVGHVWQAAAHGNFAPGNFGIMLIITILRAILLTWLLHAAWKRPSRGSDTQWNAGEARALP